MQFIFFGLIMIAVLVAVIHFMTSSKDTTGMGAPTAEYKNYLKDKKDESYEGMSEIPAPPDGVRDQEVESLLRSGRIKDARELLISRMEQARLAPIGSEAKMKRVSHYMSLIN